MRYSDKTLKILINYHGDVLQNLIDLKDEIIEKNTELNWLLEDDDDMGKRTTRYKMKKLYYRFKNDTEVLESLGSVFSKVNYELNKFKDIEINLSDYSKEFDMGNKLDLVEEGLEWLEKD